MAGVPTLAEIEETAIAERGLHRIDASGLTIQRISRGKGFDLVRDGNRNVGRRDRKRITELVIPPAWADVRIASDPSAHLQAVGRDEAGRLQYIYHSDWDDVRAAAKAFRLAQLGRALPRLRQAVASDLKHDSANLPLAAAARLIDLLHLRAGHETYAGDEGGRGAATLLKRHVQVDGTSFRLCFRGKGGKRIDKTHTDIRLASALEELRRSRGPRLFKLTSADGSRPMTASDLNRYLAEAAGKPITAKDFRTLYASSAALEHLSGLGAMETPTAVKRAIAEIARLISEELANTPAVTRKSYIHPLIIERFQSRGLEHSGSRARQELSAAESQLMRFLASIA